jgi:protein transport protein SEC39
MSSTTKPTIKDLSPSQCILLTVHYASEANIKALHSFTPQRPDTLDPTLVLRILLTYLPESVEPREYTPYIEEVASRLYLDVTREDVDVDTAPVAALSEAEAKKKVKKLRLEEIQPPQFPPHAPDDLLTLFLCHRAEKIDTETGLLEFVPRLVEPFVQRNDYLRVWYVSTVLPLLRLNWEYYPEHPTEISLLDFAGLDGKSGIDVLLEKTRTVDGEVEGRAVRDMKGLVGPWMYGHTERKRRRLNASASTSGNNSGNETDQVTTGMRKIKLDGISAGDRTGHDWEYAYRWMVHEAASNFPLITSLIEDWDGPSDVDTGGFEQGHRPYLDDEVQRKLELQYAQAAFAACYATTSPSETTVRGAHGVLARLAELLDFLPPPDLATSVDSLPLIEKHSTILDDSQTVKDLESDQLLTPEHPLTAPRLETYMLLQMIVYSAYQLLGLGYETSLVNVAKMLFYGTAESQLAVLTKILKGLGKNGKRSEGEWNADRAKLVWLWNWGIDAEDSSAKNGAGVLGKVEKEDFEEEMLGVFTETSCE